MNVRDLLLSLLGIPICDRETAKRREEMQAYLQTPEGRNASLHEIEERFDIGVIDEDVRSQGYPKSRYYRFESPEKADRKKKEVDKFLARR